MPDLPLDMDEAKRAIGLFNKLRLPDVVGKPLMRDAAGDWFRDIVMAIFGSLDQDNTRHVQNLFAMVPKKNNKTTGCAAIMLVAMLMNRRPHGEFFIMAETQELSQLAFQQCVGMIEADEAGYLQKRFHVKNHENAILDRGGVKSVLKIKTFDMNVATGAKAVGVLLDEVHRLSNKRGAENVIEQIRGGFAARPDGFLLMITTQSDEPPAGLFKTELETARKIRDGELTGPGANVLPLLYEYPKQMQSGMKIVNGKQIKLPQAQTWRNPDNWPLVNPNMGLSVNQGQLVSLFEAAKSKGEDHLRRFASQHLNVEIGLGRHAARWRGADFWESAADTTLTLETLIERSVVATVGIDGGGLDDLLGLTVVGRTESGELLTWSRAWVARDILDLRPEIAPRLEDFEKAGDLVLCNDATQDIHEVADIVAQVNDAGLLPGEAAVGLDPVGISEIYFELGQRGIDDRQMAAVPQGYRLTGAIHSTERALKDGTLWHAGQGLMAFCVGNAKSEQRGNATLITKETAGRAKIDPLVALFNAMQLMGRNPEAHSNVSIYATETVMIY